MTGFLVVVATVVFTAWVLLNVSGIIGKTAPTPVRVKRCHKCDCADMHRKRLQK